MQSTHEHFSSDEHAVLGSDRSFGLVMAGGSAAIAVFNSWHSGRLWPWMCVLAIAFLGVALIHPSALHPLNRAWQKFGLLLHKVISPIVMGLLFYGAILPTGLIMRARGKDLLRLKPQPDAPSYWIARTPPGPSPETMKDQF